MAQKIFASPIVAASPLPSETGVTGGPTTLGTGIYGSPIVPEKILPKPTFASEIVSRSLNTLSKRILGEYQFTQQGAVQIGKYELGVSGDIRISPAGIVGRRASDGATSFAIDGETGDATFLGTITAGSIVVGYIPDGGAAADVNAGIVTINGGKITAGSLTVTDAEIVSITASKITAGTIDASVINVTNLNASNLTVGNLPLARIVSESLVGGAGGKIAASTITDYNVLSLNANKITAGTIDASVISVIKLNASNITTGTLSVGGSGQPNAIQITQGGSGSTGNSRLIWTPSNSRIWADANGNIGINSKGNSGLYLYEQDSQVAFFQHGSQANFSNGIFCDGNFNVQSGKTARIQGTLQIDSSTFVINASSSSKTLSMTRSANFFRSGSQDGLQFENGKSLLMPDGGGNKTAVVPTSNGYREFYAMESTEVWFMDIVPDKQKVNTLFMEATEGPAIYVRLEDDGGYMMFRRRKGRTGLYMREVSRDDYEANERFYGQARRPVV